jgi:hypothetical protein
MRAVREVANPWRWFVLVLVVVLVFAAAGCGGDDDEDEGTEPGPVVGAKSKVPRYANDPNAERQAEGARALRALPEVPRPERGEPAPNVSGVGEFSLPQAIDTLSNDVATFWQELFNAANFEFRPASQVVVSREPIETACGSNGPNAEPAYCASDNTLVLPVGWFQENTVPIDDLAVAYPIAWLWGLQIETQIGISERLDEGTRVLLASCLAGTWAASVFQRGLLEKGDIEEGARIVAQLAGKERFGAVARAFERGFNGARAGNCPGVGGARRGAGPA